MNRPDNLMAYDELDLKLGIKSSLPHVKGTLALSVLLWECLIIHQNLFFRTKGQRNCINARIETVAVRLFIRDM